MIKLLLRKNIVIVLLYFTFEYSTVISTNISKAITFAGNNPVRSKIHDGVHNDVYINDVIVQVFPFPASDTV